MTSSDIMTEARTRKRFGADRRLHQRREFSRVFGARCVASDGRLVVHAAASEGGPARLGVVVSRRFGKAVARNRFTRLVREAFRLEQARWPEAVDIVVRPKQTIDRLTLEAIVASLGQLIPAAAGRLRRHHR